MKNIKPLRDNILIRQVKPQEKTPGGLFIPDNAKEGRHEGEVLAIGPGAWDAKTNQRLPMSVKVGDKVLVHKYNSLWMEGKDEDAGQMFILARDEDIVAVYEDSKK